MTAIVLAHAVGEELCAEPLATALSSAGYSVLYEKSIFVGESLIQEVSKALEAGSPVVLCGTIAAVGTEWAHRVVNAAKAYSGVRVFALQMEKGAYLQQLSLDGHFAAYWRDPDKAKTELLDALRKYYPPEPASIGNSLTDHLERRYRDLALRTYDIVDLANLPVADRSLATRELLLRSLYVALRVGIESVPNFSNSNAAPNAARSERKLVFPRHEQPEEARRWSVGERLACSRRLMILGDPGAGKSTLLRWIATAYFLRFNADPDWRQLPDIADLPDEDWLPILVQCRDFEKPRSAQSIEQILDRHLRKLGIAGTEAGPLNNRLLGRLSEGRAVLLIDGLDEIPGSATRASFCRQIEQMRVAYPRASIIVTSRIVGYREMGRRIGRGFEHAKILDLTAHDKDEFARRWCILAEPAIRRKDATSDLIRDIHSTDRIERLTGNPMLLTTMALVRKKVGKLPSKRADLYREAVDVLLNWRSDVDEQLDPYEALPQLEYVAYAMCASGVQRLRSDEIIDLLNSMRSEYTSIRATRKHDPLEFLRLLERRTGILVEIGRMRHKGELVPVYEFRHLTFQEYLASRALVKGHFPDRDRQLTLSENILPLAAQLSEVATEASAENWREVLRLCVMSCDDDDVDSILLAIANIDDNEHVSSNNRPRIMLAAACLSDEPNVSQDVATILMDRLIGVLREADHPVSSPGAQIIAEIGISSWGPDLSRRLVLAWLSAADHDSLLGACAATAAGQAIPEDKQGLRIWLSQQTARLASGDYVERICATLSVMQCVFESRTSHRNIGMTTTPLLRSELIKMLGRPGREAEAAAWAISWLAGNELSGQAIWELSEEQDSDLAARIVDPQTTTLTAQFLTLALTHEHFGNVRLAETIAKNLLKAGQYHIDRLANCYIRLFPNYVEPIAAMATHPSSVIRAVGARLLGRTRDIRQSKPLIALLGDVDDIVRATAASALVELGDAGTVGPLIGALVGPDGQVSVAVARALGQLGDARAVGPLIGALVGPDGQASAAVAEALGQLGDAGAVKPLIGMLVEPDGQASAAVARALGQLGDARAVGPLIGALVGPDGQASAAVARALGKLGDARAVGPLIGALVGPDGQVNDGVASALGQLGDAGAVGPLIGALVGPDGQASAAVAQALGELSSVGAVEPLIGALVGPDGQASAAVAWALGQLGDARAVEPLIGALVGPDGQASTAVAQALGQLGDAGAVEPLIGALIGPDGQANKSVVGALVQLGDARAVEPLIGALVGPDGQASATIARALGQLGDAGAVEPLIGALVGPDGQANKSVVGALVQLGDARAVGPLIGALVGPDGQASAAVAEALVQLGDAGAVGPLIGALVGPDGQVNDGVASVLGKLGDARAAEPLIGALVGPDGQASAAVAEALGQLGDAGAVEPLIGMLVEPDGQVRDFVSRILGELGDARAVEPLIGVLVGPDGRASATVARALGQLGDARAVKPLIAARDKNLLTAPSAVVAALATLGDGSASQAFIDLMRSTSYTERQLAVWALARCEQDEFDRILLSRDADGQSPGLDPEKEIELSSLEEYMYSTDLPEHEVRMRYERLQSKYLLNLSW